MVPEDERHGARLALDAVKAGSTEIVPAEWVKTYDHFIENIQDWCVSRQLWWGHQIPAWHGPDGEITGRARAPGRVRGPEWTQDPDVLDTWFSCALWPFSTLGWPDEHPGAREVLPEPEQTSDLETGYDILFFWVARMMMFGLHFTGGGARSAACSSPGLIVDETGDKMSKVKGNVIDPLDLVYGATFADMAKKTLPGAPEAEALAEVQEGVSLGRPDGRRVSAVRRRRACASRWRPSRRPTSASRWRPSASRATATS